METTENTTVNNTTSSSNRMIPIIVILLLLLGAGYYLFAMNRTAQPTTQNATTTEPTTAQTSTNAPADDSDAMTDENVRIIEVEAGSFYFKPNMITLKKGEKVKLVLNSVSMMHDYVVDELGIKTEIVKSGDTATVEFTADKVGTFESYCSVGQHRAQGQVGKLIVTE